MHTRSTDWRRDTVKATPHPPMVKPQSQDWRDLTEAEQCAVTTWIWAGKLKTTFYTLPSRVQMYLLRHCGARA